jgi:hypothetical protein
LKKPAAQSTCNKTRTGNYNLVRKVLTLYILRRMTSAGMLHDVALITTDVSEEGITSIIRVTRVGEIGTMLAITNI